MNDLDLTMNHLGFKQYVLGEDDVCPCCQQQYTNEGEGVLCQVCAENPEFACVD